MNITKSNLRRLIREEISSTYANPVEGLTGLMQEFDIPKHARKKLSNTLQTVCKNSGGPLDASYEAEKIRGLDQIDPDFYSRAVDLIRKEKSVYESRTISVSRNQIRLLVKESMSSSSTSILTEEELQEIAPIIGAIGRMAGSVASKALQKGAAGVTSALQKSPKLASSITSLLRKSVDKLPNLSRYLDSLEIDLDNPDFGALSQVLRNPDEKITGELDKVMKSASQQLSKAEKCECPSLEELQAAQEELAKSG